MARNYKPKKGWDYEDDHDYDDAIDYAAQGMDYWYGKYYPKEKIDKMFADQEKGSGSLKPIIGALIGIGCIYGIYGLGSNYMTNRAYDKRQKVLKEKREQKNKAKNL